MLKDVSLSSARSLRDFLCNMGIYFSCPCSVGGVITSHGYTALVALYASSAERQGLSKTAGNERIERSVPQWTWFLVRRTQQPGELGFLSQCLAARSMSIKQFLQCPSYIATCLLDALRLTPERTFEQEACSRVWRMWKRQLVHGRFPFRDCCMIRTPECMRVRYMSSLCPPQGSGTSHIYEFLQGIAFLVHRLGIANLSEFVSFVLPEKQNTTCVSPRIFWLRLQSTCKLLSTAFLVVHLVTAFQNTVSTKMGMLPLCTKARFRKEICLYENQMPVTQDSMICW